HRDQMAPDRMCEEHVVEAGRSEHLGRREVEELGHVLHGVGREPAVLLLGQVQQGDQGRAAVRVEPDRPLGALDSVGRETGHAYRSTSPMMGSTDEMIATASATMPPRIITGSAWRFTNDGARM